MNDQLKPSNETGREAQAAIKALLIDDHPLFLDGMVAAVQTLYPGMLLLTAYDGAGGLEAARVHKPELIISDLSMPNMGGLELFENLFKGGYTGIGIIVTSFMDMEYMEHAFDLGVSGYLLKDSGSEEVFDCIEACLRGERFVSRSLFTGERLPIPLSSDAQRLLERLTESEKRVVKLVAEFKTNKQIARELDVSFRTVQNHRYNIVKKLEIAGTHQLLQYAVKHHRLLDSSPNLPLDESW